MKKRVVSLLLALACALSLSVSAFAAEVQTVHVEMRSPIIYVENVDVAFLDSLGGRREPLLYNGTVYIPLRTAGLWMGAQVDWDQEAMTVAFTSTGEAPVYYSGFDFNDMDVNRLEGVEQYQADMRNGVDVELRSDITVTVDGQVQQFVNALGQPVYPMLFRECVYLPVRSIGELCGKQVLWLPPVPSPYGGKYPGNIFLYDAPTAQQLDEANVYFAAVRGHTQEVRDLIQSWSQETAVTDQRTEEVVTSMRASIQAIQDLPVPSFLGAGAYVDRVRASAELVMEYTLTDPARRMASPYYAAASQPQRRDAIVRALLGSGDASTYFLDLEDSCADGLSFLALVTAV